MSAASTVANINAARLRRSRGDNTLKPGILFPSWERLALAC
jgi:hypothetical protein